MMKWLVRWWLRRQTWTRTKLKFFKDKDWVIAPVWMVDQDAQRVAIHNHGEGIRYGKEIGNLQVLLYTSEDQRWKDIRQQFKFDELNAKYPGVSSHATRQNNERT